MTGQQYKALRQALCLTQAQLAEALCVSRVTIAKRETEAPGYPITREAELAIAHLQATAQAAPKGRSKRR